MYTNDQALAACRVIRPILPQLLAANLAQQVDDQLAQLLNETDLDEETKVDCLLAVLDTYPETKTWLDQFLELNSTPKGDYSLTGKPALQSATSYICPIGNDFTFYQEANEDVPLCRTHLVALVPVQS
jgi:hypothetical protein